MRIPWRRTVIYGAIAGCLVGISIRNYLKLQAENAKLRGLIVTDDVWVDEAVARGYFYFKDQQAIVLAKTDPVLIKPGEGYFRHGGVFLFIPLDLTTSDIHEALKDSAYYLEPNIANRGLPAGASLVLKRDEWDAAPLPSPHIIAGLLARYFRTHGVTGG
jgi:hypothetical protein